MVETPGVEAQAKGDATDAIGREIDALNARIGAMVGARKTRRSSILHRLFAVAVAEADIDALRRERTLLQARHGVTQHRMLQAIAMQERARRTRKAAVAQAATEHGKVVRLSRERLSIIDRVRTLLTAWPALAYLGIQRLLAIALRIEKAREPGQMFRFD